MQSIAAHLDHGWRRLADPAWLDGWNPQPFELPGGTTEIVVMGEGRPLVLLPPLPGYKEAFVACASRLARRFRVVTFDLRSVFEGRPRWEALLDDLERIADAFAPGRACVAGHSLGGALAQRWALAHPERVGALLLSSSFACVRTPWSHLRARYIEQPIVLAGLRWLPEARAAAYARWLAAHGGWVFDPLCDERVLALVRFGVRRVPIRLASDRVRLALEHDSRAELPRLACPTLVVVGERERAAARAASAELTHLIPGARLAISPGAGHLHPLSNAEWFAEAAGAWSEVG